MSYHELDTPEITIQREGEEPVTLNLIGWNNDYTTLYLRNKDGRNKVLPIVLLKASWRIPEDNDIEPIEWRKRMFPDSDPVSIVPTRLLPPPIRSKYVGPMSPPNEINKATDLEALYNDYAYPDKSDLPAIKKAFNKLLKEKKEAFEALDKTGKEKNKRDFQAVGIDGVIKFIWDLTFQDEIETNATGIRNQRLIQRWLKENNLDSKVMSEDLEQFKKIIILKIKVPNRKGIWIEQAMGHLTHQIHYKITFSCGTKFWLSDVKELRAPRSKKETIEIKGIASELPKIYTPQEAAELVGVTERTIRNYCHEEGINKGEITTKVIEQFKIKTKNNKKRSNLKKHDKKRDSKYSWPTGVSPD